MAELLARRIPPPAARALDLRCEGCRALAAEFRCRGKLAATVCAARGKGCAALVAEFGAQGVREAAVGTVHDGGQYIPRAKRQGSPVVRGSGLPGDTPRWRSRAHSRSRQRPSESRGRGPQCLSHQRLTAILEVRNVRTASRKSRVPGATPHCVDELLRSDVAQVAIRCRQARVAELSLDQVHGEPFRREFGCRPCRGAP